MCCFQILLESKMLNSYPLQSFLTEPEKNPKKNQTKKDLLKLYLILNSKMRLAQGEGGTYDRKRLWGWKLVCRSIQAARHSPAGGGQVNIPGVHCREQQEPWKSSGEWQWLPQGQLSQRCRSCPRHGLERCSWLPGCRCPTAAPGDAAASPAAGGTHRHREGPGTLFQRFPAVGIAGHPWPVLLCLPGHLSCRDRSTVSSKDSFVQSPLLSQNTLWVKQGEYSMRKDLNNSVGLFWCLQPGAFVKFSQKRFRNY